MAIGSTNAPGKVYSTATQSSDGLMSATDKTKLDGIDLSEKLDTSGGTMSGNIDMGSNRITGLADAVNDNDAVTKAQMEEAIKSAGGGTTIVQVPTVTVGEYTYDGTAQGPTIGTYDSSQVRVTGATNINAGTYELTLSLVNTQRMVWNDLTTADKTFEYTIDKRQITPPTVSGAFTYDGNSKSASVSYASGTSESITQSGTVTATNAGEYTVCFDLVDAANTKWSDNTTAQKTGNWSIQRATITLPAQSGSLTYNGSAQIPSWNSAYDSTKMSLSVTSQTNAGTHSATFTPAENYMWSDGSTSAKNVSWSIQKAAGSLSINPTSLEITDATATGTISVTRSGDGAISASSSNTSIATVSVSGTSVVVTPVSFGSATITVSVAAGTNHTAPASKTCSVSVNIADATLNNNSWETIRSCSDNDIASSIWSVGDTKSITINGKVGQKTYSNLAIDVFIIGFDHNSSKEGSNRIHFQMGKISGKLIALDDGSYNSQVSSTKYFSMNSSNTNSGGWKSSQMRTNIMGSGGTPSSPTTDSLMAALPSDLRTVLKSVTKYTDNTGGGSDTASYVNSTTDYLFLLSEYEVFGTRSYANSAEKNYQAQYAYYAAGNGKVAYRQTSTSAAAVWWLRSPRSGGSAYFVNVNASGAVNYYGANNSLGVAPGFCV